MTKLHNEKHGLSKTPEYQHWLRMVARCEQKSCTHYAYYGGRGISVYPAWRASFLTFYNYIGSRPTNKHTVDRIDNNGNYEPGNVRWATRAQQLSNQRIKSTNKSGYRGVSKEKRYGNWRATIQFNHTHICIVVCKDILEAAWMYDQYAIQLYGEFASTNFEYL